MPWLQQRSSETNADWSMLGALTLLPALHTPCQGMPLVPEGLRRPGGILMQGLDLLRDLLAIEPAVVLNAAFCERHLRGCPQHEHLQACEKVSGRLPGLPGSSRCEMRLLGMQAAQHSSSFLAAKPDQQPHFEPC